MGGKEKFVAALYRYAPALDPGEGVDCTEGSAEPGDNGKSGFGIALYTAP